jgi:hypothetical protein
MGLSLQLLLALASAVILRSRVPRDSWPYITVSDSRLPTPGGPGPCIYIPQEQGDQFIPPNTGFHSESESYVTTEGQSASLSWNKESFWGLWPDFWYCQSFVGLCGALSLTRGRICHLQLLLALTSALILGSESLGTHGHILLPQIRDFPFRHLLRLAGSRWRYSTPPPHGISSLVQLVLVI